jgi:hypothetical protein
VTRPIVSKLLRVTLPVTLLAVLITMIGIECWVRATWDPRRGTPGFYVLDPFRGQRLAENYTGWFAGVPVRINNLGFRDSRDYELAKKPNTFRILVLGDSVTFGHGSVYEHTYPYLLEQRLKAWRPDLDWQVWNAAVPGYNTSQELEHLLDVGPRVQPDLVVVGFYENDLVDDQPRAHPTAVKRMSSVIFGFLQRHMYSIQLYRKFELQLAWRLSASTDYRRRLQALASTDAAVSDASHLKQQALTQYDWLSDDEIRDVTCRFGIKGSPDAVRAIQNEPTYPLWLDAVHGFQQLHREGRYRIVFFLNIAPTACADTDRFYDAMRYINDFFLRVFSEGTPTVSAHDRFLHTRPSQMPAAGGHSLGNSNAVKADALFDYLKESVLPGSLPGPSRASPAVTRSISGAAARP